MAEHDDLDAEAEPIPADEEEPFTCDTFEGSLVFFDPDEISERRQPDKS